MSPDPVSIAVAVSGETGLPFDGSEGRDGEGHRWIELRPSGHAPASTFALRTTLAWRRIEVEFRAGAFAGDLLDAMGRTDLHGQIIFASVLRECESEGATVELSINGRQMDITSSDVWTSEWRAAELRIVRRQLAVGVDGGAEDERLAILWAGRLAAAVLALLPLENAASDFEETDDVVGLPEGAKIRVEVNRYERDRRNRAAALSIHGFDCKACGMSMTERYGNVAAGFIEVHHVTPVSIMGNGYLIDPVRDLVPLCPNCHAIAHRKTPPFTVDEISAMIKDSTGNII